MKDKNFVCTSDPYAGFMMSFMNGYTVSVQWGKGNYCENRYHNDDVLRNDSGYVHSNTAEVAVWKTDDPKQEFIDANKFAPDGIGSFDDVIGYLNPEDVVEFLKNVKDYQDFTDIKPFVIKDFDSNGHGYCAEIYSDGFIKIGNRQPKGKGGGLYWSGSREEFLKRIPDFKKETITIVEAIKKYLKSKK